MSDNRGYHSINQTLRIILWNLISVPQKGGGMQPLVTIESMELRAPARLA